ncbi:putative Na(+)/H(+) antiporter NhaA [Streptomyces aurantiacus JA 4570]|uniref:Putative Na(+)/H(+) antiporter NhaA n=1 Tax=Streptomyces aurantiacus JA 4570 TaxID=1286094 RepID=S3ZV45_9ACTN|nr:putative Na(+)/H(+) antiporter NhaA [Streptomyces aurantiacus JA 4570]
MAAPTSSNRKVLGRLSLPERNFVAEALRTETVGGVLLLVAAIAALIWANTPIKESYESVRDFHIGPGSLGLDLSLQHWAADGLLAIFFFVAGIELKRELVAGDLRDPKAAALPVIAALCGMAVPALVYTLVNTVGGGSTDGWAVPTATDIAFALAVLAVIGTSLPSALRAFLLTLAVVDDLFAIMIIAIFFTNDLNFAALGGAVLGLARRRGPRPRGLLAAAPQGSTRLVHLRSAGPGHLGPDVQQRRPRHHRRCRHGPDAALPQGGGRAALPR